MDGGCEGRRSPFPAAPAYDEGRSACSCRLPLVLQDLADFLRLVKGRRWHESFNDDGDNRYELAHDAFLRFVRTDARLAEELRQAHAVIAGAMLARHRGRWGELDPRDDADLYDLRFIGFHLSAGGPPGGAALDDLADDYLDGCFRIGNHAQDRQRFTIAREVFEQAVIRYRCLVEGCRVELDNYLASAFPPRGYRGPRRRLPRRAGQLPGQRPEQPGHCAARPRGLGGLVWIFRKSTRSLANRPPPR
jgi:hypothetical protein